MTKLDKLIEAYLDIEEAFAPNTAGRIAGKVLKKARKSGNKALFKKKLVQVRRIGGLYEKRMKKQGVGGLFANLLFGMPSDKKMFQQAAKYHSKPLLRRLKSHRPHYV